MKIEKNYEKRKELESKYNDEQKNAEVLGKILGLEKKDINNMSFKGLVFAMYLCNKGYEAIGMARL